MKNNKNFSFVSKLELKVVEEASDYASALLKQSPVRDMAFLFKQRLEDIDVLTMLELKHSNYSTNLPEILRSIALRKRAEAVLMVLIYKDDAENECVCIEIETSDFYIVGVSKVKRRLDGEIQLEFNFVADSTKNGANWILPINQHRRNDKL